MRTWKAMCILGLVSTLGLTGCSRKGGAGDHHAHHDHAHETAASTFRAGHGIQFNKDAAGFVGLRISEVVTRDLPDAAGVTAVPAEAVLRTVRGAFVFVENGEWLLRSPVSVGVTSEGFIEVKEGLYEGDRVAVAGVDALWLAEIAALNGGVGCADGH